MPESLHYVSERLPESGETITVAPGVLWLRMPLPFRLNHINLWLLEDGDGWTIVDTGIARDNVKEAWERIFATHFTEARPLKRVIVTHFHPDHMGLAGWLTERFGVELWATLGEWACGRMISLDTGEGVLKGLRRFYQDAGFGADGMALVEKRRYRYAHQISPIPARHRRIDDGETIAIGGRAWRVIVGSGHSPEHACLYCAELGVLISGDQVLPRISPNISVWPQEPEANPLRRYLDSLALFRGLPAKVLVLPSHDTPFTGLETRLDQMAHHHDERLDETLAACAEPSSAIDVLGRLFKRQLDDHELFFAIGESLAHLHFLMADGRIKRWRRNDGVHLFHRAESHHLDQIPIG